jgi:hypothetical protein
MHGACGRSAQRPCVTLQRMARALPLLIVCLLLAGLLVAGARSPKSSPPPSPRPPFPPPATWDAEEALEHCEGLRDLTAQVERDLAPWRELGIARKTMSASIDKYTVRGGNKVRVS